MKTLEEVLVDIALDNIEGLTKEEARYYLSNDAIPAYGSVSGLIYYCETEPLATKYHAEILDWSEECYGEYTPRDLLSLNNMAWFAFEYYILGNESVFEDIIDKAIEDGLLEDEGESDEWP